MAVGGQIVEQSAKTEQIAAAGLIGQRRLLFAQMAEPGEEMGIAAELGYSAYPRESSVEPGKESGGSTAIVSYAVGAQSQGKSTEVRFKDLVEVRCGPLHKTFEDPNCARFSTARAYSCQTS